MDSSMNRRDFLGATGIGLIFALAAIAKPGPFNLVSEAAAEAPLAPNVWLHIDVEGRITIASPAAELGQGSFTALPVIIAEELDADWSKVRVVQPPVWDPKKYGNPGYGQRLSTTSSASIDGYFKTMRIAGAQARRVLLDAVVQKWGVPVAELVTEPSMVVHRRSNRRISYGDIAGFAKVPAELPAIGEADLKSPKEFRLIGKDVPRVELGLKTTGAAKYAMDVQVPGMVYAAVLQAPYFGAEPTSVDDTQASRIPGVIGIHKIPGGVGVVGETVEATQAAKRLLVVTWSDAKGASYDSERALDEFQAIARDTTREGVPFVRIGDAKAAMQTAARVFRGEYRTRHVYHAQMEPLNATASVTADGKAEIWAGTQAPGSVAPEVANAIGLKPENITFHQQWVGGGFGRRSQMEVLIDAARLSKLAGKPVKLIWSREDDIAFGKFRPATAHHIEAGFDGQGKLVAWRHRVVAESVSAYLAALRGAKPAATDQIVMKGTPIPQYSIPNKLAEHVVESRGTRLAAWRGVGNAHNAFAAESFLDEIAKALDKDPLAFRLELSQGQPRVQTLLRAVAAMSEWDRRRDGRALGVSFMEKDRTLAAGVAEVSVDRTSGQVKVHNMWVAIDAGIAVQPRNLAAQTEGSIVFGLGHVLREKITIKNGRVQQTNFTDYEITRMADVPNIEVKVVSTDNPPTGAGEDGLPLVACAVGNAIAALTGARLRELPFTPERVLDVLGT
jgi:isoquinoline 1-oxidoreductase beta subunit